MATKKSAEEISGLEYDWLGRDASGCVAFFSTAGAGYAPRAFLDDTDAHDRAIASILELPASTEALFCPDLPAGNVNTWKLLADRGLYAYDSNPNGGPYDLVASPARPAHVNMLPEAVARAAVSLTSTLHFQQHDVISDALLASAESVSGDQ